MDNEARQAVEELLVVFHDTLARQRLDNGINKDFKIELTSIDENPAYKKRLHTPINLKEDITVDSALLHEYGIITTPPFTKYASPDFAQIKSKR